MDADRLNDLITAFPDGKLPGAFLARRTWTHWGYALVAAVLFMAFIVLLGQGTVNQVQLLLIGAFTATFGIFFLLAVQWLANLSRGIWLTGGSIITLIFYIVKL